MGLSRHTKLLVQRTKKTKETHLFLRKPRYHMQDSLYKLWLRVLQEVRSIGSREMKVCDKERGAGAKHFESSCTSILVPE